jgi:hypothetical protein
VSAPLVLDDNDVSTITNALSVAAESCERHAVEAEQAAIRGAFDDSARSYRRVLSRIIEADTFRYDS